MKNLYAIQALSNIATSWGGSIHLIPDELWREKRRDCANGNNWTAPPEDGHFLNYKTKELVANVELANAGIIIHELGHCFASFVDPSYSEEWDWFGWEICLARMVGCYDIWNESESSYVVSGQFQPSSWGRLSHRQKDIVSWDRIEYAKKRLLVTLDDKPIAIR